MSVLKVEDLFLHYETMKGPVKAVDGISFEMGEGRTLAFVGESGCGKTSTANSILRLLPKNVARYEGKIIFDGRNIMELSEEEFRKGIRWRGISMVFQGAMNALNPTARVGKQVGEPLKIHLSVEEEEARGRAIEALGTVGLSAEIARMYPHELSGGMKQRVVIAMALILKPKLVILDEPTSALDVMTQANIMNLLKTLKREEGISYFFITHDFALASELADDVGIMYGGELVEIGPAEKVYKEPQHPYSQGLLKSVPRLRSAEAPTFIPGVPADLIDSPHGCRFHPRCPVAFEQCGWTAQEVAEVLEDALQDASEEDGLPPPGEMEVRDDSTIALRPADGRDLKAWESFMVDFLSSKRDSMRPLQGVMEASVTDGAVVLLLHDSKPPRLMGDDHRAACLLLNKGGS